MVCELYLNKGIQEKRHSAKNHIQQAEFCKKRMGGVTKYFRTKSLSMHNISGRTQETEHIFCLQGRELVTEGRVWRKLYTVLSFCIF